MGGIGRYFKTLCDRFGDGWNRFWFTPSDPCILGPIRFLTGLVVLELHLTLWPDLVRFFGAGGWLPLDAVSQLEGGNPVSYLNYLSTERELWIAHAVGAVVLVLFTLGLFTRISSILSLVVLISQIHRAPVLASQVEPIASFMLFYLCLGPAGECFSLDAWLRRRKAKAANVPAAAPRLSTAATVSVRLMQVHTAMVYGILGLSQLGGDTWWAGMGMWWLIARPESRLVDLTWLDVYVVQLWSHAQVVFELAFAVLIWNRLARPLLLAIAVVMWALLAAVSGLVSFAAMMLIANLAFVPSAALRTCWGGCCRAKRPDVLAS